MCLFSEEILRIIDFSVRRFGNIVHIQRGYPEHFSGTFTVGTGNQGRMNITKSAFLKKFVNSVRQIGANPKSRAIFVGTRAQMSNAAQIFVSMLFLLQGKIIRRKAVNFDFFGNDLIFLVAAFGFNQSTADRHGRSGRQFFDFLIIAKIIIGNNLNIF